MFQINLNHDFKTVSEFRDSISSSIESLKESGKPLVITQQGKPAAVLLDTSSYQQLIEDYEAIVGTLIGLKDAREGRIMSSEDIKESLIRDGKMDRKSKG
jgi:prevent-host-death family protein